MPEWRKTIRLKHFLSEDISIAAARECAANLILVLKCQPEYKNGDFDEFSALVEELEGIADASDGDYEASYTETDHLNDVLSVLYDWADAERVWIA